jgi:DNA polymerase elongation subunit (family B)
MLDNIRKEDVLFLDIETAPLVYKYNELNETTKKMWDTKFKYAPETPEENYIKAGIYAEFAKIICISVGIITKGNEFKAKSFSGDNESQLLSDFFELLNTRYNGEQHLLCAHNGKEFDFPFICRRALINGLKLPRILNIAGKKPWEIKHLDTMELWKFGDYKNYTSLSLLASVFNIPTPKDDIDGSDVARVYWEEKNMERITTYCEKDVLTVAQLFLRYKGEPII